MSMSNRAVLEHFHAERQRRLRPTPRRGSTHATTHAGLRVRLGHALIGVGAAISGERVEPARHKPNPQPRTA
jgi:hypothetical protein